MILPGKTVGRKLPSLLWRNTWRYHRQHHWQSLLSVLGIMLGVMMVVAVDLASNSARKAFDLSVESVSGSITHQIVGGSAGVPEDIFTRLRTEMGLRRSAPVITSEVHSRGHFLTLIGLDLISEASLQRRLPGLAQNSLDLTVLAAGSMRTNNAVILPESVAESLELQVNDSFRFSRPNDGLTLTLAGTLPENSAGQLGDILFTDIAVAQQLLSKVGRLDSIDLVLREAEVNELAAWLPQTLTLVEAAGRNRSLEQMTEAFHINLLAMSLLALLVAALLIYNTVTLSVLERRAGFGVLRSLGVTRAELARLILIENVVLGTVAGILGVLAGVWLGSFLVQLVTRTIDDLYFNLTVQQYDVDALLLLKGFSWGLGLTLLASALPAWHAGQSPPVTLQQQGQGGELLQRRLPWFSMLGLAMMLVGYLVLQIDSGLVAGFAALFLLVFGFCMLVPQCLHWLLKMLLALSFVRFRFALRLALRNIQSGLDRTALAVAALTVAVSVTVGVGIMVSSLRDTVVLWLDQTLAGDVQVTQLEPGRSVSAEVIALIHQREAVTELSQGYLLTTESEFGSLRVQADSAPVSDWLFIKSGELPEMDTVMIAEPMASRFQLTIGDTFEVLTANGLQDLTVSGIFYDYTTGDPLIAMSETQLLHYWPSTDVRRLTLHVQANIDQTELVRELRGVLRERDEPLLVTENSAIHSRTFDIFDRTFAITHVLRVQAIMVAFVGVFSALLALQLQRLKDYAVLRASGMTTREIAGLIIRQTLVMGALAGLLSVPLGLLMSEVLVDVINMRSFGWSMQHSLPLRVLAEAIVLAVVAAFLAGLYPARRVAQVHPAAALRGE